jgi:hypothetical protein
MKFGMLVRWSRGLAMTVVAAGSFAAIHLRATVAAGADACATTTKAAASACKTSAKADLALALGKCANLNDATARKACRDQAKADYKDSLNNCSDQTKARAAVCSRLGGAAYDPVINPSNFVAVINNPYMTLTPGTTFVYVDKAGTGNISNEVTVTTNTLVIAGVTCVEVHDTVYANGVLTEDTLDWFAQDTAGNVWYFGENSKELDGVLVTSVEGSFQAGVDNAKPGIIMKANPTPGDFYRQEFDLSNAEDIAEVADLTNSVVVPYGSFTNCLRTIETSPLEPDALENKFYKAGVGNLLTIDLITGEHLELVAIRPPS